MKIVKFIIYVLISITILVGIPFFIKSNINIDNYYTTGQNVSISGPMGYFGIIANDSNATADIKQKSVDLMEQYITIIKGLSKDFNFLILILEILLAISLTIIGFLMLKYKNDKIAAYALFTSSIISIILYIINYYSVAIFPNL